MTTELNSLPSAAVTRLPLTWKNWLRTCPRVLVSLRVRYDHYYYYYSNHSHHLSPTKSKMAKRDGNEAKWLLPHFHSFITLSVWPVCSVCIDKNVSLSSESFFIIYFYCDLSLQWRWVRPFLLSNIAVDHFPHVRIDAPNRPINLHVIYPKS